MGDHAAAGVALEGHAHVLQWPSRTLCEARWVRGGFPLLAADLLEMLIIDDHMVLWQAPRRAPRSSSRRRRARRRAGAGRARAVLE
eukprot:3580823-Alexandrium_andersonii.AAC.1